MVVVTKVYDTYSEARRAVNSVEALNLPQVEAALVGHETHEDFYTPGTAADPLAARDPLNDGPMLPPDTASGTATGAGIGAAVGGGAGLLAGLGLLAIPGIGPLVAAGWLAATAVGAASGALAGGALGAIADIGLSPEEAPVFSEAIRRGGVGVSVRFPEENRVEVEQALGGVPTTSYTDLRQRYESEGWRADETDAEREARLRDQLPPDHHHRML